MSTPEDSTFKIGASHIIGSYILPGEHITTIHKHINKRIKLDIAPCTEILKAVKSRKVDFGFVEYPIEDVALSCHEWMEEEMVICARTQLPSPLRKEDLNTCKLICANIESVDRTLVDTFFREQDIHRDDFESLVELDNPTAIIQNIKWSKPHEAVTSVAIVSKLAIEYELKYSDLYSTFINNMRMFKKLHIIYRKDSKHIEIIKSICETLLSKR